MPIDFDLRPVNLIDRIFMDFEGDLEDDFIEDLNEYLTYIIADNGLNVESQNGFKIVVLLEKEKLKLFTLDHNEKYLYFASFNQTPRGLHAMINLYTNLIYCKRCDDKIIYKLEKKRELCMQCYLEYLCDRVNDEPVCMLCGYNCHSNIRMNCCKQEICVYCGDNLTESCFYCKKDLTTSDNPFEFLN
jgi:hypothetical protein